MPALTIYITFTIIVSANVKEIPDDNRKLFFQNKTRSRDVNPAAGLTVSCFQIGFSGRKLITAHV